MIPEAEEQPLWALWPDAGQGLGWTKWTTYRARDLGQIPTIQIAGRCYVIVAELRRQLGLAPAPDPPRETAPATPTGAVPMIQVP